MNVFKVYEYSHPYNGTSRLITSVNFPLILAFKTKFKCSKLNTFGHIGLEIIYPTYFLMTISF